MAASYNDDKFKYLFSINRGISFVTDGGGS